MISPEDQEWLNEKRNLKADGGRVGLAAGGISSGLGRIAKLLGKHL